MTESYLNSVKRGEDQGTIDVKVYCKLGHLHLLLENFAPGEEHFLSTKATTRTRLRPFLQR